MLGNVEELEEGEENSPEQHSFLNDISIDVRRQTSESLERTSLGRFLKTRPKAYRCDSEG